MTEFVEAALHAQIGKPILTVLYSNLLVYRVYGSTDPWNPRKAAPCRAVGSEDVTYSSSSGHGPQQAVVDFDNLLDSLTRDPVSSRSSRVRSNDYTTLEAECKRCRTVGDLDGAVGVRMVVSGGTEPGGWLSRSCQSTATPKIGRCQSRT